jgi:hypothetical protein
MQVHELAAKSANFADLTIDASSLYLLAAPSTPDEAREAVIERSERGETLTHAEVKKMIADAAAKDDGAHAKAIAAERERTEKRIAKLTAEAEQKRAALEADHRRRKCLLPKRSASSNDGLPHAISSMEFFSLTDTSQVTARKWRLPMAHLLLHHMASSNQSRRRSLSLRNLGRKSG